MAEINDLSIIDDDNIARFPEGMLVKNINNSARKLEGIIARWDKDTNASITPGGTADIITIAANQTLSAYYDGLVIAFEAGATNTGAVTINVDSLGAKSLKKRVTVAMAAGEIISGQKVIAIYDGTNFQIISSFLDVSTAADAAATAADVVLTHADVVSTNADVVSTNADVVSTNADAAQTALDAIATAADAVSTAADVISSAANAAAAQVAKIEWQGTYSGATAYALNDAVTYLGSSYICIQAGTGQTPVIGGTAYWDDLANKGTDGAGDVNGPASATDSELVRFDGTTGQLIKAGGKVAVSDLATGTDGELITWDASGNPITVAVGTAAQVLTSNGTGAAPTFQDAAGGAFNVISSGTLSAASELLVTGITKTITIILELNQESSGALNMRVSDDGGTTYEATDYTYHLHGNSTTAEVNVASSAQTEMRIGNTNDLVEISIVGPNLTTQVTGLFSRSLSVSPSNYQYTGKKSTSPFVHDAVRIFPASGTITGKYAVLELN